MRLRPRPEKFDADLRITPVDLGFDPRVDNTPVAFPSDIQSATFEREGTVWLIEGTAAEIRVVLETAGYTLLE